MQVFWYPSLYVRSFSHFLTVRSQPFDISILDRNFLSTSCFGCFSFVAMYRITVCLTVKDILDKIWSIFTITMRNFNHDKFS